MHQHQIRICSRLKCRRKIQKESKGRKRKGKENWRGGRKVTDLVQLDTVSKHKHSRGKITSNGQIDLTTQNCHVFPAYFK